MTLEKEHDKDCPCLIRKSYTCNCGVDEENYWGEAVDEAYSAGIQAALDALPKELGSATAVAQFDSGRGVTEMGMSGVQGFNVAVSEAKEAITKLLK